MRDIKDILWKGISYERRQKMDSHLDSMSRELNYLKLNNNSLLLKSIKLGWTRKIIKIVCVLSVFNHYIIGPLSVSCKHFSSDKIDNVTSISHGSLSLDDTLSMSILEAYNEFYNIINALHISLSMLHSTNVRDILFYISRNDEDENN